MGNENALRTMESSVSNAQTKIKPDVVLLDMGFQS